jgi:hypothetical protein
MHSTYVVVVVVVVDVVVVVLDDVVAFGSDVCYTTIQLSLCVSDERCDKISHIGSTWVTIKT